MENNKCNIVLYLTSWHTFVEEKIEFSGARTENKPRKNAAVFPTLHFNINYLYIIVIILQYTNSAHNSSVYIFFIRQTQLELTWFESKHSYFDIFRFLLNICTTCSELFKNEFSNLIDGTMLVTDQESHIRMYRQ